MRWKLIVLIQLTVIAVSAQEPASFLEGSVSFLTAQNVYVKFDNTSAIEIGDTLYLKRPDSWEPLLTVSQKSSISCACIPLGPMPVKGTLVFAITWKDAQSEKVVPLPEQQPVAPPLPPDAPLQIPEDAEETPPSDNSEKTATRQRIMGRFSAASYSTLTKGSNQHRMRYSLNWKGENLGESPFSVEGYLTFRHTAGEWEEVRENLFDVFKIISLAVRYDPTVRTSISVGRRINARISSMGAIDGIQVEHGWGKVRIGVMAGSRPDFMDYSINPALLQGGAWIGFDLGSSWARFQNTAAFVEQRNGPRTDRRFLYFQHSGTWFTHLHLFLSSEVDLYRKVGQETSSTLSFTNLFASLRYRFSRQLSASISYDNRKNVIFFESYKNFIDQLIEQESRQGLRFQIQYKPWRLVSIGANASWRFQASGANPSRNLNGYVTMARIPWISGSMTVSGNILSTGYLQSNMYSIRYMREIVRGRVSADAYYRWIDYTYPSDFRLHNDLAGINVTCRLTRLLAIHLYYEAAFGSENTDISRLNAKITHRIQ